MRITSLVVLFCAHIIFNPVAAADLVAHYGFVAPGFAPVQTIDMSQFWGPAGLQETGTNYYTSGGPKANSTNWERFNPQSPYYQVWSGAYVINNFAAASEWNRPNLQVADIPKTIQRLILLASVDQIAWLTGFLDPHPHSTARPKSVKVFKEGPREFSMYLRYDSDSDLGWPDPLFGFYPGYAPFAHLVEPNAPVVLDAVVRFTFDDAHQEMLVRYSSSSHWTLKDGTQKRTPLGVQIQQGLMMLATSFR